MITNGVFYQKLDALNNYSDDTKTCIETAVANLQKEETTYSRPGMLLGKIQSGKTRTFIGIIALCFDNGYDVAVVLTKGTKALAQQTWQSIRLYGRGAGFYQLRHQIPDGAGCGRR